MKILIVSDTHRKDENLQRVIAENAPLDMLIHLGDSEGSEGKIAGWAGEDCELHMVLGNNDFFSDLDREKELKIGQYRVLLTHGHYYNVSLGVERLEQEARERNIDIAMYGHTHRPFYEVHNGMIILNPGSLSYPRQEGRRPSYMLMEIDEEGEAHFTLNFL
ncbi:metallophosphoesterase [Clostridium sp. Marseille-P2415]|uniref:metallophosphoesterase n=1 Tax=Clostridium sp. Marseille-P2415 TaxID=1805471 RepID=UPI0009888622|nr:metallophosphoesterase [Clostridium sp. Marseille-P2415]